MTLYFAPEAPTEDLGDPTQYAPQKLSLPYAELSRAPGSIVSTAILGSLAGIARERGYGLASALKPLVGKLVAATHDDARELPEQCRGDAKRALAWGQLALGFETEDVEALDSARAIYKELLRFEQPDIDAQSKAEMQLNFAAAGLAVGEAKGDAAAMEDVVTASHAALADYTQEENGAQWAFLQNRLGRALAWLGERRDDPDQLRDAVAACRSALQVWQREESPVLWAVTQHRLGDALAGLGRRTAGTTALEQAAAVYRQTLRKTGAEDDYVDRTVLRRELAHVLSDLGSRLGQRERHEEAVQQLEMLAKASPNLAEPADAAHAPEPETLRALGRAWFALARNTGDPLDMAKASRALKRATEARPEGEKDREWGETYRDLGRALFAIGTRRRRGPLLKDATGAFHSALDLLPLDDTPKAWATTQHDLVDTLLALARHGEGVSAAEAAREACDRLLEAYGEDGDKHQVALAHEGRGDAFSITARISEDEIDTPLEEAIAAYRAGLGRIDRAGSPLVWARLQSKLADALAFAGGHGDELARLEEAAGAYRASIAALTPEAAPGERARGPSMASGIS